MKKRLSAVIFSTIFALIAALPAAAKVEKSDAGVYAAVNASGQVQSLFRFNKVGNRYWVVDMVKEGAWSKLICAKNTQCMLTDTSRATMRRFFSRYDELIAVVDRKLPKVSVSCIDVKEFAFCRLDDVEKTSYFLISQEGNISVLQKQPDPQVAEQPAAQNNKEQE
ncbi:hypothetical protein [Caviibacterium pharyngocola]|uniref:Uncharacterized protein n=1 Tax=Caviibacterium pharyngocola TaxID=28159 RepID=A0A2M8RUL9_9PAST|nr:hypothetical protein [Caviibacterium pharyngocola]PJG82571.1 hypothetical protein CVP04_08495 [Caviibacterium pharyngocola]